VRTPPLIARVLWLRRRLREHERWSPAELHSHQQQATAALRRFAYARSPFYREFHRDLQRAPLGALPPLSKATLMDHFDEISTDRALRLADVQAYLEAPDGDDLFRGRYWVAATSGSSGRRSVIPSDAREWATVIAGYARANEWAGVRAGVRHRTRMAVVSSATAWHQSSRVAASVRGPFVASERLDAAAPLRDVVTRLNALQPEVLVGYASMIRVLAAEQLAGRLRISPRAVNCSSEVLTDAGRQLATRAWGVPPFDVYAATETGGVAAECDRHRGMHLLEDLVLPEVVDDEYRPVPDGEPGDRLLVTVLFSRTLPLIRYELTDRVQLSTGRCPCGRPFRLVQAIEGRTDDVLILAGADGAAVRLHPVVFHQVLDLVDAAGWQVRQDAGGLDVLVASPAEGVDPAAIEDSLRTALRRAGAAVPSVAVRVVDAIPAGRGGKRPLVVARRSDSQATAPSAPDGI
jgi:putative adenylate-forming enzyme